MQAKVKGKIITWSRCQTMLSPKITVWKLVQYGLTGYTGHVDAKSTKHQSAQLHTRDHTTCIKQKQKHHLGGIAKVKRTLQLPLSMVDAWTWKTYLQTNQLYNYACLECKLNLRANSIHLRGRVYLKITFWYLQIRMLCSVLVNGTQS